MPAIAPALSPIELLRKYNKPVPRYTSYPTAAAFEIGIGAGELSRQLAQPTSAPLSLYVHVPFCRHACWYCGCNRVTTQLGSKVVKPYLASLGIELEPSGPSCHNDVGSPNCTGAVVPRTILISKNPPGSGD